MYDMTVLTQVKSDWPSCGHFFFKELLLLHLSLVSISFLLYQSSYKLFLSLFVVKMLIFTYSKLTTNLHKLSQIF